MSKRIWRKDHPPVIVEGRRGFFDVPYNTLSEMQKLDLWRPEEGDGPFPVGIAIHGGGFVGGTKRREDMLLPMLEGLDRGYAVASVEYRLNNEATFPEPVRDIKRAIRFLRANAEKLMIDPERMVTWGGSAGGYFTTMSSVFEKVELFDDPTDPNKDVSAKLAGAVGWYSLTDCTTGDHFLQTNSIIRRFIWQDSSDVDDDYCLAVPVAEENEFPVFDQPGSVTRVFLGEYWQPDKKALADPNTYINSEMPPVLLQHGSRDEIVPMQHSIEFGMAINKLFGREHAIIEIIPEAIHSSVLFETKENIDRVFRLIGEVTKK